MASVGGEVSVDVDLGAHQEWSGSQTQAVAVKESVTVPPGKCVKITGYVRWADDLKTTFTLRLQIQATAGSTPLTGDQIVGLLLSTNKPEDVTVVERGQEHATITLRGSFLGNFGIDAFSKVEDWQPING